jgi:RNA polymerase sigma-70 factor (ECF subfamily)
MMAPTWAMRDVSGPDEPDVPSGSAESRNGSPLSFAEVHARYFEFVWSSARRLGVPEEAMDDVVQNVFIVIHAKLATLERPESLRSWIYGIARRLVLKYFRAQRQTASVEQQLAWLEQTHGPAPKTPLELTEHRDQLRLLAELLAELDPLKREVLVLAEMEELTPAQIAEALEIPLNTVYSRLRAARTQFEEGLARHHAREARGKRP